MLDQNDQHIKVGSTYSICCDLYSDMYHQYPVLQCARARVHDRYIEQFSINFVWIDFIAKSYRSAEYEIFLLSTLKAIYELFIHHFYGQNGIRNKNYHFWPKNDCEKWSRKIILSQQC